MFWESFKFVECKLLLCKVFESYWMGKMTLSLGYLTAKQKMIWDLKSRGQQEASIARKLNVTRQTIHSVLDTANLKIGEALQEIAKINKIEVETLDPNRGFLKGYSNHFKTQAFITFSAKNGIQLWYKHEGDCEKCNKLQTCRDTLLCRSKRPQLPTAGRYEQDFALQTCRSPIRKNNR